jgi:CDP-diacylglycerol---glycerol-3-phosphate 3-phosphatidyltransferase
MTSSPGRPSTAASSDPARGSVWNLPNQITIARLILSVVFFVILGLFDWKYNKFIGQTLPDSGAVVLLDFAITVFVLAAATDFLDGYLARKWGMISTFGRIADPFVDKVFICGSFIFLIPITPLVQPWLATVIMAREFLVSGLRSFIEARGVAFGSGWSGKWKMGVQSITVPFVLLHRANFHEVRAMRFLSIALLALTLLLTVSSTVGYVKRAMALLRDG